MSRTSMAAALPGPTSPLFGIGRYGEGDQQVYFEIGWAEFDRDVRWVQRVLATWDVRPAEHVLITTPNFEAPWSGPLVRALREWGTSFSNAEPYSWDVRRSATLLKLLPVRAIIGMSEETATALLEHDHAVLLGAVPLIWARPDAVAPLRAAGLRPAVFAMLGPALGLECPQRSGVHLDPAEWRLDATPAGPTLSTAGDRVHRVRDLAIGPRSRIDSQPCPCGLPGPLIRLAETQ